MKKKPGRAMNKYDFGVLILDHCLKVIAILIVLGIIIFVLQIKKLQYKDFEIEKQALKTQIRR